MSTSWLLVFEYVPFKGKVKVEEERIGGTEQAAINCFNAYKGDPRFARVSLVREVRDRQIMREFRQGEGEGDAD
jgi:hypothetical protein